NYFAAAIEAHRKQDPGKVVIYTTEGQYVNQVTVGALPDMITITPDGSKLIVANEGEPSDDYTIDPEGSISIINISKGVDQIKPSDVKQLDFEDAPKTIKGAIKSPNVAWQYDLEPEYVAVNPSGQIAAITCQESNVLIMVDLINDSIINYYGLGFVDHSIPGNELDASDRDGGINLQNWPLKGAFQPDAIASFELDDQTYFITANEGDSRSYTGYSSETRIKKLVLDSSMFPNAKSIQEDNALGRLKTFTKDVIGDTDGDGDIDELYSYGTRSFSIWDVNGKLVWDSGSDFEKYIAKEHPSFFNCNKGEADKMDKRSDNKGPEPEAIAIGKIGATTYAFIGLERQGGVMVYDITNVNNPSFETYINSLEDGVYIDIAPEGIAFIPASENHTGNNLLIVSNEVSGTLAIYGISEIHSKKN
ncbi:MAG: choice-of-anchor I family protein, partial [Flavobacteriales bacterium]|nr:choice-of-anchor I family protein [Flavobacteriales bacterium]